MSTIAKRTLPKCASSGSDERASHSHKPYQLKDLLKLLLNGQRAEVSKVFASLPKNEGEKLKRNLLHWLDILQKKYSAKLASGANKSLDAPPPSPKSPIAASHTRELRRSSVPKLRQGVQNPTGAAKPDAAKDMAMMGLSASERANLELAGKYKIGEVLGKGGFGTVLKAVSVETGGFVAIKQIDRDLVDESQLPSVMEEAELLKRLDHPNIVKIYSIIETKTSLYFVLEYVESGSLATLVKKFGVFPESLVAIYIHQTLKGLQYLHEKGVIHRDIKGDNILITKEGKVKLADFGTAKLEDTDQKTQNVVGTPYWMAPEVIDMTACGTASDIWSVGCTVIELLTGAPPYFEMGPMTALFNIVEDEHPPLPENISPELNDFLLQCFKRDPNTRPSAKELQEHPFLKKYVKQLQVPMDLETVTGTIRMHNQTQRRKGILDLNWNAAAPVEKVLPGVNVTQ